MKRHKLQAARGAVATKEKVLKVFRYGAEYSAGAKFTTQALSS